MDSKWQVLDYTNHHGHISYTRGRITTKDTTTALAEVDFILLGQACTWGYGLVAGAERFNVGIAVCDWKNTPIATLLPWSENTRVCARHRAQAALTEPRRNNAWMRLTKAKIDAQANLLHTIGKPHTAQQLKTLATTVRTGDPDNKEAHAARLYWTHYLHPSHRFRRDPDEPDAPNQLLNYGYTILRSRIITRIVEAGLTPTLALHHHSRSNQFALADDLIEPFRPVVDHTVWNILNTSPDARLDKTTKQQLVATLAPSDETETGGTSVKTQTQTMARNYARYVEGNLKHLPTPTQNWNGR